VAVTPVPSPDCTAWALPSKPRSDGLRYRVVGSIDVYYVARRDRFDLGLILLDINCLGSIRKPKWLLSQPHTPDREICLTLVFELDKLNMSDLPQTDWGDAYRRYAKALESGLDDERDDRRVFFLTSVIYFGYIEHLLTRIGLISIRQIITRTFIDTLAKGVGVICIAVATLLTATMWYGEATKQWLVLVGDFCGIASMFLFYEFVWTFTAITTRNSTSLNAPLMRKKANSGLEPTR
jgi:hypothetical protein